MAIWQGIERGIKAAIPPAVLLAIAAYFGWNATQGDHGLKAYSHQQEQLVLVKQELARVTAEAAMWEHRVAGLRSNRLDPDALDEKSRKLLNLADPADIVVQYGPGKQAF